MKRALRRITGMVACFAGVLTLIFAPPLARAQLFTLSSITGWWDYDGSAIREVDPATGATISFKWITLPPGTYGAYTTGLAAHPTTGEFFALVETAPSPTGPICQHLLAKIDPATGAATIIGNTGACFDSLAFHSNGTLYGVTMSERAVPPSLFTLDTTSATPTFLISLDAVGGSSGAVAGGSALAFNPSDGLLYRSGRVDDSDQIFQAIDPDTLAVTDIPLSGSPTNGITALTHSFENALLGADAGNRLFSITTEGVRTLIGPIDHLPRGLAFATTLGARLTTNRGSFGTGDLLTVSVSVENLGRRAVVDFYFGAVLPDGDTVVFFTDLAFASGVGSLANPATLRPIVAGVDLTTPFTFNQPAFFTHTWTGGEPRGEYLLFIWAVKSGDNSIDRGDIVVLSTAAMEFAP
jgi:hypothetical protein